MICVYLIGIMTPAGENLYCMLKLFNLVDGPPSLNVTCEQSVLVKQKNENLDIVPL